MSPDKRAEEVIYEGRVDLAWNDGLTGKALEIAETDASPLRVLAGPGTGKSFAMKRRVARLLEEGGVPKRILAVTFTRNAAAELQDDISSLGVTGSDEIAAGTLHSFCFRLLSREDVFAATERHARPLLAPTSSGVFRFEAEPLIADLRDPEFGGGRDKTKRVLAFEARWARRQVDDPGLPVDPLDQKFHASLIAWLRFHEAILIGELVSLSLEHLEGNPLSPVLKAYDHVVVDEYQDLNRAEQDLVDILARRGSLAIVGDEDQSIYSFRHANPEGIVTFHTTRPTTLDKSLDECRRCPSRVVAMADHLIRQNHLGHSNARLQVRPGNPEGDVSIVQWSSLEEEIAGVIAFVQTMRERGIPEREILILCPRKLIGYQVRDGLNSESVPSHSFYQEKAIDGMPIEEAFSLLTLLANPRDRVAYRYWLGARSQNCLAGQYRKLMDHCMSTGAHPRDVLQAVSAGSMELKGVAKLQQRHDELERRLGQLGDAKGHQLVEDLFPEEEEWAGGMREAWMAVGVDEAPAKEIHDLLRAHISAPEIPTGDFVRVMSLHKSKGLTASVVVVMSCVRDLIPTENPDATPDERQRNLEEQRRLFYVAMTRARQTLVLSSFATLRSDAAHKLGMRVRGRKRHVRCTASPFLGELGQSAPAAEVGTDWISRT